MATKTDLDLDSDVETPEEMAGVEKRVHQSTRPKRCPGCKASLTGSDYSFGAPGKDCEGPPSKLFQVRCKEELLELDSCEDVLEEEQLVEQF